MTLKDDPLWFKSAIIYEVPVRAFADSNGDGIGDFRGLTEKLDYLQDLGVTAIWLLPFFPSPLRDDGYDIADYTNVNPIYGTIADFQELLQAAHDRGIRVIIELIVNHTSDQHPWFQRARSAPAGSPEREFYVWSDTLAKYQEARIIFQDFETSNWAWDPVAQAYYWHRFYAHQPDLNYDNPAVQQAVFDVLDFWLSLGVDGLRMDAVPYLYEREGTNCENLPETHTFLKQLRQHVDTKFPNRMLLAEANQWPEDAAAYYGDGDECHMNFHFPLMPRLFMALRMEDNFPIMDILQQTPPIPDNCQWGLFLRNHDELTLEMVTDEDRDYMYRVYAQDPEMRVNLGIRRRLAPLLSNDRRQIELLNSLLLSLPGTPVLYYGDEIGMGDNVYVGDRNGVRTPMQWSDDRNAGFSRANPHRLYLPLIVESEYHYATVNVEAQRANPNSLLNAMKRLIATRKRFPALSNGDFQLLHPVNRKVLAFVRTEGDDQILVVANLSRFVQVVDLDLSAFKGRVPIEIFGRTEFPAIEDTSYFLSLGPYAFYWFSLKRQPDLLPQGQTELPTLTLNRPITALSKLLRPSQAVEARQVASQLEGILPDYLAQRRWFDTRTKPVQSARIVDAIAIPYAGSEANMLLLQVDYIQGTPQTYRLFLAVAEGEKAIQLLTETPQLVVARLRIPGWDEVAVLFDAIADPAFLSTLLEAVTSHQTFRGVQGELTATGTDRLTTSTINRESEAVPLKDEHNNTSVIYGDGPNSGAAAQNRLILKLFRKVEAGINPDLEMRLFLDAQNRFQHTTSIAGWLEYCATNAKTAPQAITVGILQEFIPDARNTWDYTLDSLRDYFETVAMQSIALTDVPVPTVSPLALQAVFDEELETDLGTPRSGDSGTFSLPPLYPTAASEAMAARLFAAQMIGAYLANVRLLGQRTAELHVALASDTAHPDFAPEPFSTFYQRSIYQYARNLSGQVFLLLQNRLTTLPPAIQPLAKAVLQQQSGCLEQFHLLLDQKITAMRTRYHDDYHLGQVLYTGKDFFIIDFEGKTARPLSERRMKRSPLRDVAGMLQSFHDAANTALQHEMDSGLIQPDQRLQMQQWGHFWTTWVSAAFLHAYLQSAGKDGFLPKTVDELRVLLDSYLLEKAIYDLGEALNYHPNQLEAALGRILQLQGVSDAALLLP